MGEAKPPRRARADYRHFERLRVRWSEIDQQQIVFNGHYLTYFDVALAGYWRSLVLPYADSMAALEGDMVLRKATVDYLASARYDDVLDVGMRAGRIGTTSLLFEGTVFRGDEPLVDGELVYVFVAPHVFTPKPVPAPFRDSLRAFEAGEPMLDVRLGAWPELCAAAAPLRTRVFVEEQGVPAEIELDAADADAVHAIARNRLGAVLATGRLLVQGDPAGRTGKIGRMAVDRAARNSGVGRMVLDALTDAARARGDRELVLNAQSAAERFYGRAGFVRDGDPFEEAGIAHVAMRRSL